MKAPRQRDRLEVELKPSCDKYGHSFRDDSERFPARWPQDRPNKPLADRFGHICRSAELASSGDGEARGKGIGNRLPTNGAQLSIAGRSGLGTTDVEDVNLRVFTAKGGDILGTSKGRDEKDF